MSENRGREPTGIQRVALGASEVCLLGAGGASILAYLGPWSWLLDLLSHFRLQYLLALALGVLLAAIIRVWWLAGLCAAVALLDLIAIAPLYFAPSVAPGRARMEIAHLNVRSGNGKHEPVQAWLRDLDADVVLINELSDHWVQAFSELPGWRLEVSHPRGDNFGIGLLVRSDRPEDLFITRVVEDFGGLPAIEARTGLGGQELAILAIHTMPPVGNELAGTHELQMGLAAQWATAQREAGRVPVVVGDLNCTPYSSRFQRLAQDGRLIDSEAGFGPQGSFPASYPTRIPIDHALHDSALVTLAREVGPDLGSDHRPLRVTLAVAE